MSELAIGTATYEDLLALPDNVVGEILNGELLDSPRPASLHALASSALGSQIFAPFHRGKGGPGGWVILDEPELHLGSDILVPDMAGWRRERMPEMPDTVAFTLAPDWVCEVLSASTEAIDRARKMPRYAQERVAHVWLVGCATQTIEVYRLDGESYRLIYTHQGSASVRLEPFDAIEFDVAALWER